MADPPPCADISRDLLEPLLGTASRVRNWLLIEHYEQWEREAVAQRTLGETFIRELKRRLDRYRTRLLLIRRPAGRQDGKTRCFVVHSDREDRWIQRLEVDHVASVLDVDLGSARAGQRPSVGDAHEAPLYLVCTHGEHDPCCGRFGAPVAASLASARPVDTWESSHVGGDRFAANLVCLPHGLYFGRVPAARAGTVASLYESGTIDLDHYRGRSIYDPIVQAAEIFVRRRDHLDGIDELAFESRVDHATGRATVTFTDAGGAGRAVQVAARRTSPRRITCAASGPGSPREYRVVIEAR